MKRETISELLLALVALVVFLSLYFGYGVLGVFFPSVSESALYQYLFVAERVY